MKKLEKRQINIDLLRILACLMVVMIHISAVAVTSDLITSNSWKINVFLDAISRASVPLFMMITGKLLLEKPESPQPKEIFTKYVLQMLRVYVFWSLFYFISSILLSILNEPITIDLILCFIMPKYHLWYIAALIVVYLMMPLFYALRDYKEGLYLKYFVKLFIVFGVIKTTVLLFPFGINTRLSYIPKFLDLIQYPLVELSGYFLLGYYVAKNNNKKPNNITLIIVFLTTVLFVTFLTYLISFKKGFAYLGLYEYFVIFTFIEAVCLFKIFLNLDLNKLNKRKKKLIVNFSELTFGIYLIHIFVQEQIVLKFRINFTTLSSIETVPLFLLIIIISTIFVILLKKISFFKKIL